MEDLFVYKYRPDTLNNVKYQDSKKILQSYLKNNNILNTIIYGLKGSGKKTLLYAFLKDMYGSIKTNYIEKKIKINSKDFIFPYFFSKHHIEIDISNMKSYSRIILPLLIKENAEIKKIDNNYRLIVIHNSEYLDEISQNMLRRIFEKYYKNCRFMLLTKRVNKIIKPLQSRCVLLKVKNLETNEIQNIMNDIIDKEQSSITYNVTSRNIKYNIFNLEIKIKNHNIKFLTYENDLLNILDEITSKKITKKIYEKINNFLYNLVVKNVSFNEIFEYTLEYFFNTSLDDKILEKIVNLTHECEKECCDSLRRFFHIQHYFFGLIHIINI